MSGLDEIVQMTLTTETQQVSQAGFGTPLILGATNRFVDKVRSYSAPGDMVSDGFLVTDPEYLAAQAICAQNPRPSTFKVASRTNRPAMSWKWTPLAKNATKYTLVVDGQTCEFTSDANATVAEIVTGMRAAIVAKAITGITATDNTTHLTIAGVAGVWHTVLMSLRDIAQGHGNIEQDGADAGVAADLAEVLLYDPDWYSLKLAGSLSKAEIVAAAAWIEANGKIFVEESQDSAIITSVVAGATDVAAALKTAGYARTSVLYHPNAGQMGGARWQGKCLPLEPGSETWMFKTLGGLDVCSELTPTHIANAKNKKANLYRRVGGIGITSWGFVAAGEWIDIVRFRDWLQARMQERVFGSLANAKKIPFTDKGISVIEKDVRAQLDEGVDVGGLEGTYSVSVPKRASVSDANVAARHLPDVEFTAVLAGAIHDLEITGALTYTIPAT